MCVSSNTPKNKLKRFFAGTLTHYRQNEILANQRCDAYTILLRLATCYEIGFQCAQFRSCSARSKEYSDVRAYFDFLDFLIHLG